MEKQQFIKEMSEPVKAYIAGIVDGEGSILVTRTRRPENRSGYRFYATIQIVNTCKDLLDWIVDKSGLGTVYRKNDVGVGAKRECHIWKLKHKQCKDFLEQITPYLIVKKSSAENCLEFCKETGLGKHYDNYPIARYTELWLKSSELNKRGVLLDENIPVTSTQGKAMAVLREAKKVRPPNKKYESHEEMLAARRLKYRQHCEAKRAGTPLPFEPLTGS